MFPYRSETIVCGLPDKLTVAVLDDKFPSLYILGKSTTVSTGTKHLSLSWAYLFSPKLHI